MKIYKMAQDMTGKADIEKVTELDVDPKELSMGLKIEMEHTKDKTIAKQIALDHLTEDPKYYTHLIEMEEKYANRKGLNKEAQDFNMKVKQSIWNSASMHQLPRTKAMEFVTSLFNELGDVSLSNIKSAIESVTVEEQDFLEQQDIGNL